MTGTASSLLIAALLLLVTAEDDRAARPEEEAGLEAGVGEQVEDARPVGADADADEHEAELAHRRVGEHLLDVVLEEADGRGEQRGQRADDGHQRHGGGSRAKRKLSRAIM